jgi:glycosyltransferase involved in cell wall biosynthesis
MIEVEHARRDKVHVILNGIDFDRAKPSGPDARFRIRREFGAEEDFLLLIVARLHPEKGHHYLFEAMAEVRRRVARRVRLLVAGAGSFEQAYRDEVRALGCADGVSFLGFRKDSADLMAAADLVILPSLAEAFGLALTESLYIGTPVVATRVGGIPEIVDDGADGLLVTPADSKALADAIIDLLNDEGKRRRMAGAGREKVIAKFRFEEMVRSYESLYADTIGGQTPAVNRKLNAAAGD